MRTALVLFFDYCLNIRRGGHSDSLRVQPSDCRELLRGLPADAGEGRPQRCEANQVSEESARLLQALASGRPEEAGGSLWGGRPGQSGEGARDLVMAPAARGLAAERGVSLPSSVMRRTRTDGHSLFFSPLFPAWQRAKIKSKQQQWRCLFTRARGLCGASRGGGSGSRLDGAQAERTAAPAPSRPVPRLSRRRGGPRRFALPSSTWRTGGSAGPGATRRASARATGMRRR